MKVIAFEEHYKLPAITEEHRNEALTSEMDPTRPALRRCAPNSLPLETGAPAEASTSATPPTRQTADHDYFTLVAALTNTRASWWSREPDEGGKG